jgi:hypothetical protein
MNEEKEKPKTEPNAKSKELDELNAKLATPKMRVIAAVAAIVLGSIEVFLWNNASGALVNGLMAALAVPLLYASVVALKL